MSGTGKAGRRTYFVVIRYLLTNCDGGGVGGTEKEGGRGEMPASGRQRSLSIGHV